MIEPRYTPPHLCWLQNVAWEYNPFDLGVNHISARAEEQAYQQRFSEFVLSPVLRRVSASAQLVPSSNGRTYDLVDLELPRHTFVFGAKGTGKSSHCIKLQRALEGQGKSICIDYSDLAPGQRTFEEHVIQLGNLICAAAGVRCPQPNEANPFVWLEDLCREINKPIFILIDEIEDSVGVMTRDDDVTAVQKVVASIKGLLQIARIWEISKLYFKIFLWDKAESEITQDLQGLVREGVIIDRFTIRWTKTALQKLIDERISRVAQNPTQLRAVAKDNFDIDGKLIEIALKQESAPRYLIMLIREVIQNHYETYLEDDFLLRPEDIQAALQSPNFRGNDAMSTESTSQPPPEPPKIAPVMPAAPTPTPTPTLAPSNSPLPAQKLTNLLVGVAVIGLVIFGLIFGLYALSSNLILVLLALIAFIAVIIIVFSYGYLGQALTFDNLFTVLRELLNFVGAMFANAFRRRNQQDPPDAPAGEGNRK